ncbi:MAG: alpha-1,4-glucan--maltose-1-phosphate maltosyltransferase [Acidimicrobiia bacterium]|nr:alpha-1,4-glucan--maltose-1-phosphate maltosyltransferase [Acidimicrobiia bacterium]
MPPPASAPSVAPRDPTRVVVEGVRPEIDAGRFPAKSSLGEAVEVEADVFTDGHDLVAAAVWVRPPGDAPTIEVPMAALVNDRFAGSFTVDRLGRWAFTVVGWLDRFSTWSQGTAKKIEVDMDVAVELQIGSDLVAAAAARAKGPDADLLAAAAARLTEGHSADLADPDVAVAMRRWASREPLVRYGRTLEINVERERARHGAWYEFFPRSASPDPARHGTLADATRRLDYVAGMGFDIVYLPPIHPVGRSFRKGPNNSVEAAPGDTGSPWGIGSEEGGHTAVHPELGTFDDFAAFVDRARELDLEVALDIAFQCAPDHPWVTEHPEWFTHRPDGTIQYAENPPKKYQDIYPIDFESENWEELWDALADVVRFWIDKGVSVFRVDNPHTKPFRFWEWLITTIHAEHPEAIFLSEAFTRPKVMYQLAKVGFSQSYTYFAWRQEAWELREYLTELTTPPVVDFFRPNAWPNTPDILTEQLQHGGRPVFLQRLVLAATLSANYGVYGPAFELVEHRAVAPGSEEYLDSEKYQQRHWDLDAPHSLRDLVARVNDIRRSHPALLQDRTLRFHRTDNQQLLCYSKTHPSGDIIVVVVNVDGEQRQAGFVDLDLESLGLEADSRYEVRDLLGATTYQWAGARNFVELDPHSLPAHIFAIAPRVDDDRA